MKIITLNPTITHIQKQIQDVSKKEILIRPNNYISSPTTLHYDYTEGKTDLVLYNTNFPGIQVQIFYELKKLYSFYQTSSGVLKSINPTKLCLNIAKSFFHQQDIFKTIPTTPELCNELGYRVSRVCLDKLAEYPSLIQFHYFLRLSHPEFQNDQCLFLTEQNKKNLRFFLPQIKKTMPFEVWSTHISMNAAYALLVQSFYPQISDYSTYQRFAQPESIIGENLFSSLFPIAIVETAEKELFSPLDQKSVEVWGEILKIRDWFEWATTDLRIDLRSSGSNRE